MTDGTADPIAVTSPETGIVEALFSRSTFSYAVFDRDCRFVRVNRAYARLYGKNAAEFSGRSYSEIFPDDAPSSMETRQLLEEAILTGKRRRLAVRPHRLPERPHSEITYWDWLLEPIFDDAGAVEYVLFTAIDVTELKRTEELQIRLNRALRLLSDCNQILIHADDEQKLLDDLCRLIVENGGYLMAWVGYAQDDEQKTVRPVAEYGYETDYLAKIRISWANDDAGRGPTGTSIRTGRTAVNQDYLANPEMAPWRVAAIQRGYQSSISLPLNGGGRTFGALAIYSSEPYSFNPEEVKLLVQIAQRLQTCLQDSHTISRESGDEFVVLLSGMANVEEIGRTARKILDVSSAEFEIGANILHTSFSIGISICPDDGADFETLRKNADTALYRAKDGGRNNYRFFTGQMDVDAKTRLQMQISLRSALANREFRLHYQPQVRLDDGRIIGVEALLRWQRADAEPVAPSTFIPAAEQSGLIIPIGEWVIDEACRQAVAWRKAGLPDLVIAVNLSAMQFRHGNIVDSIAAALQRSGMPPYLLELELTESILLQDVDVAMTTLHTLKAIGVKLSIDDFGTGYSSLSYLKRLAVDKLKVDKSFVHDLAKDADGLEIIRAIIQLGHILKLEVVAEGVETEEQLALLRSFGCDQIQGYLFSRPLPAEAFPSLFAKNDG